MTPHTAPFPPAHRTSGDDDRRIGAGEWSLAAFVALGLVLALMA